MTRLASIFALCALAFCGPFAFAQPAALPQGVTVGPSVEGVTEYRFPNGLRAVLFPDGSKPTITVNVTYLVGSRHEGYGETGMAHLLEHMLFKGTVKRPRLVEEFAPRAARRNGTTNADRTNYYETFPASDENLRWALDLEADRMVNSTVRREDLDSEMTVVRNELERGDNEPGSVLSRRMAGVAFDWHNYQNSTIGNRSDIENVGIDNLRAFYRLYYQPDNAVLVVAGKFDTAFALRTIADTFGAIPRPTRSLPRLWTVEPTQDGERSFAVRRQGEVPIVMVGYKSPGARHADHAALSVAALVLGMTPGGRLHAALVESGKAVSVGGGGDGSTEPGLVRFTATLKPGGAIEEAEAALLETIESFAATPPTEQEVKRAKALRARLRDQVFSSTDGFALALTTAIAQGDWRLFFYGDEQVAKVTPEQVREAAARYLRRDARTVGRFIPTAAPQRMDITAAPEAELLLKDFKGRDAGAAVAEFDSSPANLDARTRIVRLPVGMKVALLPKPARGEEVHVRLALHFGDLESLRGRTAAAGMMALAIGRGTTRMSRQEIADRMNELKMSGTISGGNNGFRTTRENLPAAIALMAHVLQDATFPEKEFDQARAQLLAGLQAQKSDVNALASNRLARQANAFPPGDPRYAATIDEFIEWVRAVKREDVVAMHRELLGASFGDMAVVGDFDPDAILPVIEREFGSWKSPHGYTRLDNPYRAPAPLDEAIQVPDKASATFMARLLLPTRDDDPKHPEFAALTMANYILGGSGFSSRLFTRIRGKEGLSYGVSSSLANNSLDEVTTFSAVATAAPASIGRVALAFREELQRLRESGITEQELAEAKRGMLQQRAQARTRDETVAASWVDKLHRGTTWAEADAHDRRLDAVTREDVVRAARDYLDPARLMVVRVGTLP